MLKYSSDQYKKKKKILHLTTGERKESLKMFTS